MSGLSPSSSEPSYKVIVDRVREAAQILADDGVGMLMETGQESASELLQFINDPQLPERRRVNFDPANMILYGSGDPMDAISILNRHIQHVHIKDAVASPQPRMQWGREVPFGTGDVPVSGAVRWDAAGSRRIHRCFRDRAGIRRRPHARHRRRDPGASSRPRPGRFRGAMSCPSLEWHTYNPACTNNRLPSRFSRHGVNPRRW